MLSDGKYFKEDEVKFSEEESLLTKRSFKKAIQGEQVTFEVHDSTYSFSDKEWARVVCVFLSSDLIQLKDFPPQENGKDRLDDK